MSSKNQEQQIQGIRFVNEFPEATIFTLSFDWAEPLDLQVQFPLGADELCFFQMSVYRLSGALLPIGYLMRAIVPYTSGTTQFSEIKPTTEGDFTSGFEPGLMFDFSVDGGEYQIWLPLGELNKFLDSIMIADEIAEFRPRPLALRDLSDGEYNQPAWQC